MLIRFTVENFLSFNQRTDFNMIASEEERHKHHVIKGKTKNDIDLLKASVMYGANASGKSNLIKAMAFAKEFIVQGVDKNKNIHVETFKLDKACQKKPARFEFEIRLKGKQYAYGFSADKAKVCEEWLYEIGHQTEQPIFERTGKDIAFDDFRHGFYSEMTEKEKGRIEYEAEGTRQNLLFLTNCQERNIKEFMDIYDWFEKYLTIIFPTNKFTALPIFMQFDTDFREIFHNILNLFDLGINEIRIEHTDLDKDAEIPHKAKEEIKDSFPYGKKAARFLIDDYMYNIQENQGKLESLNLIIIRDDKDNNKVIFEYVEESDGTQRIIDLIPIMILFQQKDSRVFVIDEIERSLHPLLIKNFFDFLLNNQMFEKSKSQLIASTHEVHLLDINKLFRKDEIWFAEKNKHGETSLYSLANADTDNLDLVKGYLKGRFGAIPFIKDVRELGWRSGNAQSQK